MSLRSVLNEASLPVPKVEAGIRLLAASAGKIIEHDAPFINLILPNGARFSAALPQVSEGPTFSIRLHRRDLSFVLKVEESRRVR
jgi:Flp pilus assembly CpaF family ATPase